MRTGRMPRPSHRYRLARTFLVVVGSAVFLRTTLYIVLTVADTDATSLTNGGPAERASRQIEALNARDASTTVAPPRGIQPPHGVDLERVVDAVRAAFPCGNKIRRPFVDDIQTRNNHWQLFDRAGVKNELLVYSAFYDDRPDVGFIPVVRVLGLANVRHEPFFCQIWYDDIDVPYISKVKEIPTGRGDRVKNVIYGQHLYTCVLPSAFPLPTYISLTTDKCQTSSIYLPIIWPIRSEWKHEYGVCVPISHDSIDPSIIVEWIELNRLFGVSEINVYNGTLSSSIDNVLEHYQRDGILKVHQMPPPVNIFSKQAAKLGSPASLNDCMMRNMYRYRFVVLVDFDEIIVPHSGEYTNYTLMLDAIDRDSKRTSRCQSYTFRNTYFWLDFPPDLAQPEHLMTLRYRTRLPPSPGTFAPKSFVDPRSCVSVFNHYCYIRFPNSPKEWTTFVGPNFGRSHHYKKCNFDRARCTLMSTKQEKDDTMLRFKDIIQDKATQVLQTL